MFSDRNSFIRVFKLTVFFILTYSGAAAAGTFHKLWGDDITPNSIVTMICQDKNNYLWFGIPRKGTIRYDGQKMKVFKGDLMGTAYPTGCVNDNENLVMSTRDGIITVDVNNEILKSEKAIKEDWDNPKLPRQSHLNDVLKDNNGDLWFLGSVYIYSYDQTSKTYTTSIDYSAENKPGIYKGDFDENNNLWFSSVGLGVEVYNNGVKIKEYVPDLKSGIPESIKETNILKSIGDGKVLVGLSDGLYLINSNTNKVEKLFSEQIGEGITQIEVAKDNTVWVAGSKVYKLDLKNKVIKTFFQSNNNNPSTALLVDKEDSVWVSFVSGGLFKYAEGRKYLEYIKPINNTTELNTDSQIQDWLEGEGGGVWFGTASGLYHYNIKTQVGYSVKELHGVSIQNIVELNNTQLLVSGDRVVFSVNTASLEVKELITLESDSVWASISDMVKINDNEIWIAFPSGISVYYIKENKIVKNPSFIPEVLSRSGYTRFAESPSTNEIYITAYSYGVYIFNKGTRVIDEHIRGSEIVPSFSVVDIKHDDGYIYSYYEEEYITKYNPKNKSVERLDLPIPFVGCVSSVGEDMYLLQTDGDAFRYNVKTKALKNLTKHKHVETETITGFTCLKMKDGRVVVPTYSGVLLIDPNEISETVNEEIPNVRANNLIVNGVSQNVDLNQTIFLDSHQRNISMNIYSLSFVEPSLNQYKYKLLGEHGWVNLPDQESTLTYSNLEYGSHALVIKGSNNSGVWSKEKIINIEVDTPVHLTKGAYLIYLFLFLVLTGLVYRYRMKNKNEIELMRKKQIDLLIKTNKKLKESANEKNKFLSGVSHELRTPLTGIQGMAEMLGFTDTTKQQERYLSALVGAARQMVGYVDVLLNITKLRDGKFQVEERPFEVKKWAEGFEVLVKGLYLKSHLNVNVVNNVKNQNLVITSDPEALIQILLNLTNNAVKFTKEGRVDIEIDCSVLNEDANLRIVVKDTGVGIPINKVNHIFEEFTQLGEVETTKTGGSGLGLSICDKLIKRLGGSISVNSTEGVGSEFVVNVVTRIVVGEGGISQAPIVSYASKNTKILIVEDNETNRDIATSLLELGGGVVHSARSGSEALKLMNTNKYDVIFLDCHMPEMSGYELAKKIRANKDYNAICLIALTADISKQSKDKCSDVGMDDFISKPYMSSDLYRAINRYQESKEKSVLTMEAMKKNNK